MGLGPYIDGQFLRIEEEVQTVDRVWDLPLIGAEQLDAEHAYQQLTGGPEVALTILDGGFVCDPDGYPYQLQGRFDAPHMKEAQDMNRPGTPRDSVV